MLSSEQKAAQAKESANDPAICEKVLCFVVEFQNLCAPSRSEPSSERAAGSFMCLCDA